MAITVAFKETELGMRPCHPSNICRGDIFYLVEDGIKRPLRKATGNAQEVPGTYRAKWDIPSIEAK